MCDGGEKWNVLVLAASRGPDDPMAARFGVSHKCLIEVGGKAMLARVIETLRGHDRTGKIMVSIEDFSVVEQALDGEINEVAFCRSATSAPASVIAGLDQLGGDKPVLVTTADHALLDDDMVSHFISACEKSDCDLCVGLATADVILTAYPDAKRTFLPLGPDRVSGCNLFAVKSPAARQVIEFWKQVEQNRKKPLKLIGSFGFKALASYFTGRLNLKTAFELASQRTGVKIRPVLMPQANAAIDVDKPEDKMLVEEILSASLAIPQGADKHE